MMKKLFNDLWWLSDEVEAMKEFCEITTTWCDWVRFYAKAKVIDPYDFNFKTDSVFIIHNLREKVVIERTSEVVEYISECYDEYDDKEYWEDFWIPRIKKIIEKY